MPPSAESKTNTPRQILRILRQLGGALFEQVFSKFQLILLTASFTFSSSLSTEMIFTLLPRPVPVSREWGGLLAGHVE